MDQPIALTKGSCARLLASAEAALEDSCVLQFLSIKPVGPPAGTSGTAVSRYRIIMSDGDHYIQAMLATQLNHLVVEHKVIKNSIVCVERLTCNYVQGKRLVIILALSVQQTTAEKIGDPQSIDPPANNANNNEGSAANQPRQEAPQASSSKPAPKTAPKPTPARAQPARPNIYPIEGLSPYQHNWTILVRITQKSDMKNWSNARGEGKLFNVTMMDESGEIRGTAFNQVAESLYAKLEEGKVYYVSKARVNLAKKKFSNVDNDYELGFERNTEIEECLDSIDLPVIKYNFVPLNALKEKEKDAIVDVIGVVKDPGTVGEITSKTTSRKITKRDIELVDQSGFAVRMTLWGKQAEEFNPPDSPVVAFRSVKVGDFGGVNLSMNSSSTMQINPEIDECFTLRGWYDSTGNEQSFQAHSSSGIGGGEAFRRNELATISAIKEKTISEDKAEYFSTRATIMHIKEDNFSYPGCPTKDCSKKVTESDNGYWCEKCDKSWPAPEHRYIMSLAVSDHTGQAWFQAFNEVAKAIMGMSANELMQLKDSDNTAYTNAFHKASHQTFNFAIRGKLDNFNQKTRTRYGITKALPIDYKQEAGLLRDLLNTPWGRS
ncbi:replication factor-A protein 1 [Pluteus cervinus]|uniref:Replication factor-A protein 1 n=1 Tax=Pluteus cervinus TaxID=181527 RepID=A0ACD3BFB3_9AGAR|nr:replication factor-A protein 1 [Pluteus cervinus]